MDHNGHGVTGRAIFYGKRQPTCNEAELAVSLDALRAMQERMRGQHVLISVWGDSDLVIRFSWCKAYVRMQALIELMDLIRVEVQELAQAGIRLIFAHTKREKIQIADFLVTVALQRRGDATWEELGVLLSLGDEPLWDP